MGGWSYDGRKMTLGYDTHAISFVRVSDEDAKNIGGFMMGFGLFLIFLAIVSTGELINYGHFTNVPFAEGTEMLTVSVFLVVYFTIWFAPRGAIALVIMAIGFIMAVGYGREALQSRDTMDAILMFASWYGGLLIAFLMLWPYPWWPGLVFAYVIGGMVPLMLLTAIIAPGSDLWHVLGAWVIALIIEFFGTTLRYMHTFQQDLEGEHYVRYGGDAGD